MGWVDSDKGTLTEADFLAKTTADATSVIVAVPSDGLVMASRSPNSNNSNTLPYIAQEITKDPEQTICGNSGACDGKDYGDCGRNQCVFCCYC